MSTFSVDEDEGPATITVTRVVGQSGEVTLRYALSDSTADPSDYTRASGVLTFKEGEASKTFTVTVTDDQIVESNETITLTLSDPTGGATLGLSEATLTIVDDDESGTY